VKVWSVDDEMAEPQGKGKRGSNAKQRRCAQVARGTQSWKRAVQVHASDCTIFVCVIYPKDTSLWRLFARGRTYLALSILIPFSRTERLYST